MFTRVAESRPIVDGSRRTLWYLMVIALGAALLAGCNWSSSQRRDAKADVWCRDIVNRMELIYPDSGTVVPDSHDALVAAGPVLELA